MLNNVMIFVKLLKESKALPRKESPTKDVQPLISKRRKQTTRFRADNGEGRILIYIKFWNVKTMIFQK